MKFTAKGPFVYLGDPRIHAVNALVLAPTPVLLICDALENREQVATRVADLLTKHWMEDGE